jgi:hypothetical protein
MRIASSSERCYAKINRRVRLVSLILDLQHGYASWLIATSPLKSLRPLPNSISDELARLDKVALRRFGWYCAVESARK